MMLSIVIPTYQRWDLLRNCLASVYRHAPPQTEVLVVDDASPGEQIRQVVGSFPAARLIRLSRRSGFARAANSGIHNTQGEIVELLNDDAEVTAGWATHALGWFADPSVAAVAPLVLTGPDGLQVDSAGDRYYLGGVAGKRGHGQPVNPAYLEPKPVFGASASSAFYRRSALEKVGLFPESFGSYFEDVDLAFRLQRAGFRTMFAPQSRVLHRVSASFGRKPGRKLLEQQSRNEERVFWRNLPAPWLWRAVPHHLAVLAGKAWRRWQDGTLTPFLCGRLRLLGELHSICRHRRSLACFGTVPDPGTWQVETQFWST
jgi:GT2 family glycosyltransferase